MPRVTSAEVKVLIQTAIADVTTPFIVVANTIVNENLVGKITSEDLLTMIELYLAAHFVAITEERGGLVRDSFGDAAESYANIYGQGFASTRFGQQALAFDTSSTLASIGSGALRAQFRVV